MLGKIIPQRINLSTLSADTAGELDVLGHNGDTLGVDGANKVYDNLIVKPLDTEEFWPHHIKLE